MATVISFTCQHLTYLEVVVCVFSRINQAEEEGISVVDVDSSYIYQRYQCLVESVENVTQPNHPGPPPPGWKVVNESTYKDLVPSIPLVTTGQVQ